MRMDEDLYGGSGDVYVPAFVQLVLLGVLRLAARIMARSPNVCRLSMRTLGRSAAAATALPTVVGMS